MNIREYKRNLMIVKNIESDIIAEAYFILKSGAEYEAEERISEEAERIIRECGAEGKKKRRAVAAALTVLLVIMGVAAVVSLAMLIYACLTM